MDHCNGVNHRSTLRLQNLVPCVGGRSGGTFLSLLCQCSVHFFHSKNLYHCGNSNVKCDVCSAAYERSCNSSLAQQRNRDRNQINDYTVSASWVVGQIQAATGSYCFLNVRQRWKLTETEQKGVAVSAVGRTLLVFRHPSL